MRKTLITIIIIIIAIVSIVSTVKAEVEGITADNYLEYEKPIKDEYGFNKGECNRPYLEGEEYFYDDYYDHWNVDKVYDKTLIPQKETKTVIYKKNLKLVKKWVKKHYRKYKIKVVKYNKVPRKRKSKKVIYIEKIPTISDGGYNGHCVKDGSYVRYSASVPKGVKQNCYCVWNPKNNIIDDVIAFANCDSVR